MDTNELRKLALAAHNFVPVSDSWYDADLARSMCRVVGATEPCAKALAPYIAAASPATILTLLSELERAKDRVERLEGALRPFAELSARYLPEEPCDESTHPWGDAQPFVADFHRARAALENDQ